VRREKKKKGGEGPNADRHALGERLKKGPPRCWGSREEGNIRKAPRRTFVECEFLSHRERKKKKSRGGIWENGHVPLFLGRFEHRWRKERFSQANDDLTLMRVDMPQGGDDMKPRKREGRKMIPMTKRGGPNIENMSFLGKGPAPAL